MDGQVVVKYGDAIGAHGADIVSVSKDGRVFLWDAKFRSNPGNLGESPTFTGQAPLANAVSDARQAIMQAENLSPQLRQQALRELRQGNFEARTVADGQARNSVITTFRNGRAQ